MEKDSGESRKRKLSDKEESEHPEEKRVRSACESELVTTVVNEEESETGTTTCTPPEKNATDESVEMKNKKKNRNKAGKWKKKNKPLDDAPLPLKVLLK